MNSLIDSPLILPPGTVSKPKLTATNDFVLVHREIIRVSKQGSIHLPESNPIVKNEGRIISVGPEAGEQLKEGMLVTFVNQTEHLVDLENDECVCAVRRMNITSIKG